MKIRAITYFCNPGWPLDESKIQAAGAFLAEAKAAYEAAGFEVETLRMATPPFVQLIGGDQLPLVPRMAVGLEKAIQAAGIAYASLGPAQPEIAASYAVIPDAVAATRNVFFSGVTADPRFGVSFTAARACAEIIVRCATVTPDGFANLRFAALANVKAGSPFFPAAYHDRPEPAFAIATEAADLAVETFTSAKSVTDGQWALAAALEGQARSLAAVGDDLSHRFSIVFGGIDFSLAPFPQESRSIGAALECLGVAHAGQHGSLAAAAILTEAVERARFPRTGFSGLMLPVLEDSILAQRAAEGLLSVTDLLLYSAVCGTGLDTIPLPGDTGVEEIAAVLLDLSALALRLDKPLTARLMPIPGKKAGDATDFQFDYFANSRILALKAEPLKPHFSDTRRFMLSPRRTGS